MKKVLTYYFCDVCEKQVEAEKLYSVNYPVIFYTSPDDGKQCEPYISQQNIDICKKCKEKCLMIKGKGCQGINKYAHKDDFVF